jgi:trehalose/maltose hydrolase-like predicted phosphorylase
VRETVSYYDERTSHGSTLSFVAHAGVLSNFDVASSWERFMVALESDVGDVQGGTTAEGIHLGVMSGTLDVVQRCYLGESIRDGVVHFNPKPIDGLEGMSLPMRFRGTLLELKLDGGKLTVGVQAKSSDTSVSVGVGQVVHQIKAGESHTFPV